MYIAPLATAQLVIWSLSAISGIGLVLFYFNFRSKEKRLPFATRFSDLEIKYNLKKEEIELLSKEIIDFQDKKAQRNLFIAEVENAHKWLEENRDELLKLKGEREIQETLRQEILKSKEDSINILKNLTVAESRLEEVEAKNKSSEEKLGFTNQVADKLKIESNELLNKIDIKKTHLNELNINLDKGRFDESLLKESIQRLLQEQKHLQTEIEKVAQLSLEIVQLDKERIDLKNSIEQHYSERDTLLQEKINIQTDLLDLREIFKEEQNSFKKLQKNIDELNKEYETLKKNKEEQEAKRNSLQHECEIYTKKINAHNIKSDNKSSLEDLEKPVFKIRKTKPQISEHDALKSLEQHFKKCNITFPNRLIYSFHTSLKINDISPLVVLAGISGTGKSLLPRSYADGMGIYFLNMAVQPRWDSPQDIFGFYNYLEGHYKATELSRALIQVDRFIKKETFNKDPIDDQLMMALFDEMNLARVEYYFSDFLSKLEMRRGQNVDKDEGRKIAELNLDLGKSQTNDKNLSIYVDRNVLLVGTMNEDETTQSLSDKILDRANVIRFGKPNKLIIDQIKAEPNVSQEALGYDNWKNWLRTSDDLLEADKKWLENSIDKLNEAMTKIGRPFGYRVSQSIYSYVANYPGNNNPKIRNEAFVDQIEQKIMPKLRNVICADKYGSAALNEIKDVIENTGDADLFTAFDNSQKGEYFEWKGVERK